MNKTFLKPWPKFQPQGNIQSRRKNPRVHLRCYCYIGMDKFEIKNISVGGFRINSTPFLRQTVSARIAFPLGDIAFQTTLPAQQIYNNKEAAGYRFIEVEEIGISLIRGMIFNQQAGFPLENKI